MQSNFLDWLKKFGPAQNILGPVKGQGIRYLRVRGSLKINSTYIPKSLPYHLLVHWSIFEAQPLFLPRHHGVFQSNERANFSRIHAYLVNNFPPGIR